MLIPQGMAYAMIAGLPPIYGLYASTLPLLIYAILGTSRQLAVGPVAMVSLLTATGIGALAESSTQTYIMLAITLAFFVGAVQFLIGALRLGFLVSFLSHPVISGFTSAAALIIGFSQLKHLLGIEIGRSHHVHEIILQAIEKFNEVNLVTLAIGVGGIGLILLVKRINRAIPAQLLAVIFGILVVFLFGLTEYGVKIVGDVPGGLPSFSTPSFDPAQMRALLPIALAIALVSFMESIAVAKAIQAKHGDYKVEANQELIALGLANIGGSFLQSYPVTGGFSRTAVNDQAGAKTGMASIISAALIILTLLFLTDLFYYLPNAILASVIMVAVFGLIDIKEAVHLWRTDRSDFFMLLVTFLATLTLGIELGIGLGVLLSLGIIVLQTSRPHIAALGRVPDTELYRNQERFSEVLVDPKLLIVRFDAQLFFGNVDYFKDKIEELIRSKGSSLEAVIINAESINNVDSTGIHALEQLIKTFQSSKLKLYFCGVKGPVRDAFQKTGLVQKLGAEHFFLSIHDAVKYHHGETDTDDSIRHQEYIIQSND